MIICALALALALERLFSSGFGFQIIIIIILSAKHPPAFRIMRYVQVCNLLALALDFFMPACLVFTDAGQQAPPPRPQ